MSMRRTYALAANNRRKWPVEYRTAGLIPFFRRHPENVRKRYSMTSMEWRKRTFVGDVKRVRYQSRRFPKCRR